VAGVMSAPYLRRELTAKMLRGILAEDFQPHLPELPRWRSQVQVTSRPVPTG